jgi:hypothetical protein
MKRPCAARTATLAPRGALRAVIGAPRRDRTLAQRVILCIAERSSGWR